MQDLYNCKCPQCKVGDTFNKFNKRLAVVECSKCGFITNLKNILTDERERSRQNNPFVKSETRHSNRRKQQSNINVRFVLKKRTT